MAVVTDVPWSAPPPSPRAIPGVLDVWRADLGEAANDCLLDSLCAEERERAARILGERERVLWARSRVVLRILLGRYLDLDPRELRFELGLHGKPALHADAGSAPGPGGGTAMHRDAQQIPDLRFNLSHSGELMLVAVTAAREVGVDVEMARERYTAEFLREWTMREATVKCLGAGLTFAPPEGEEDPGAGLWTAELDVGPQATAAVVAAGAEKCELRCWTLTTAAQAPYTNGSSPATSRRRGATESRSETVSSEAGRGH